MDIKTHPKEITRENVKEWLKSNIKKLKRRTSRNDLDRLILSIERMELEYPWSIAIFENRMLKLYGENRNDPEVWMVNAFQHEILTKNPHFYRRKIRSSELNVESGEWSLCSSLSEKAISLGGEAIILGENFENLEVAIRIQVFDSALFTNENEEFKYGVHLSKGPFNLTPPDGHYVLTRQKYQEVHCRKFSKAYPPKTPLEVHRQKISIAYPPNAPQEVHRWK